MAASALRDFRLGTAGRNCQLSLRLLLLVLPLAVADPVSAETWAERLGFPPGSKVLVLHANELGMCYETNAAWTSLHEKKHIRSGSVIVPAPWFDDFVKLSNTPAPVDIGVELTLNSEWEGYRWKPVAASQLVASLIDADGFLWRAPLQTMVSATPEDVEQELRAQIQRAKEAGLRPAHLTTHLGTLVTRADLVEIYLRVARQEWIPAMIVELTPEHVARFAQNGFPLPEDIIQLLSDYPLPKVDDLRFAPDADSYEAKKQAFLEALSNLSPGITQIVFHPAIESEALKRITPDWQQRVWEAQLLADPEVHEALASGGFIVTDWREMIDRFESRKPSNN